MEAAFPGPGANPAPAPVPGSRPERNQRGEAPDLRLLAAIAGACGVPAFSAEPVASGTPGRVWWLRLDSAVQASRVADADLAAHHVLKLAPGGSEAALLAAEDLGLRGPRLEGWVTEVGGAPVATASQPTAHVRPMALCLATIPGRPLSAVLHAGGAIPVTAWAHAMAGVHMVPANAVEAAGAHLPRAPSPSEWCARQLPALATEARRLAPADVGLFLVAATDRLAVLAASATDEPVVCHGDWAPDHVLVAQGAVAGVADWEHACLAPAGYDLATAVLGLFASGLSVRAALALGHSLAAAYAAERGGKPPAFAFPVAALALEHAVAAVSRRAAGGSGSDVAAWAGLLGVCLGQG